MADNVPTKEDIKKMSLPELNKTLGELQNAKIKLRIELESHQSHDQKSHEQYKKAIARIKTEINNKKREEELTSKK